MAKIADFLADEKPREKLLKFGAANLSNCELLAILLGAGKKGKNVLELSHEILQKCENSWRILSEINFENLTKISGIGPAKAILILASFEIARRGESEKFAEKLSFKNPEKLARYFLPFFRGEKKEVFSILLFDFRGKFFGRQIVGVGRANKVAIEPRDIFAPVFLKNAAGVVLMHNHPHGDAMPSRADLNLTAKLMAAAEILQIKILDHLILAGENYFSFAENGRI